MKTHQLAYKWQHFECITVNTFHKYNTHQATTVYFTLYYIPKFLSAALFYVLYSNQTA